MSASSFPCFMRKKGYRGQTSSSNNAELDEEGKTILETEAATETRTRQL